MSETSLKNVHVQCIQIYIKIRDVNSCIKYLILLICTIYMLYAQDSLKGYVPFTSGQGAGGEQCGGGIAFH